MITAEDMSDDALPDHHDAPLQGGSHLNQSMKFAQAGEDAMSTLIASSAAQLKSDSLHPISGVMLVDLHVHVGDAARAFIQMHQNIGLPSFYYGVCVPANWSASLSRPVVWMRSRCYSWLRS